LIGWPRTISIKDNYARTPLGWLPEIQADFQNPVFQVVNEQTGDLVYSLRVKGDRFTPWVFEPGTYTVHVLHPETGKERAVNRQSLVERNPEQ